MEQEGESGWQRKWEEGEDCGAGEVHVGFEVGGTGVVGVRSDMSPLTARKVFGGGCQFHKDKKTIPGGIALASKDDSLY